MSLDIGEFDALISDVSQLLSAVGQGFQQAASASQQQTIETATLITESKVEILLSQQAQILADVEFLRDALVVVDERLRQQIGTPQQADNPVVLPTTPPAGYGAPSSSSNASAVWAFLSTDESIQMGTIMSTLSAFTRIFRDSLALPGRLGSWATYNFDAAAFINNPNTAWINIDAGTILPTHTDVLAWLNDIYFHQTWNDLGDSTYWSSVGSPSGNALVYVTMTQGEFRFLQYLNAHGVPGTNLAPVWPGLSGVTLGTPVAISRPGQTISVPCDGVIISIASTETSAGKFSFDTAISWRNAGALSFFDDNGEQEFPQSLGFEDCVYVPQSMAHAAGVRLRYSSIVSGTVTPFNIN